MRWFAFKCVSFNICGIYSPQLPQILFRWKMYVSWSKVLRVGKYWICFLLSNLNLFYRFFFYFFWFCSMVTYIRVAFLTVIGTVTFSSEFQFISHMSWWYINNCFSRWCSVCVIKTRRLKFMQNEYPQERHFSYFFKSVLNYDKELIWSAFTYFIYILARILNTQHTIRR